MSQVPLYLPVMVIRLIGLSSSAIEEGKKVAAVVQF